jgi:hypothetical protein
MFQLSDFQIIRVSCVGASKCYKTPKVDFYLICNFILDIFFDCYLIKDHIHCCAFKHAR